MRGEEGYDELREVGQGRAEELHVVVEVRLGQGACQPVIAHVKPHLAPPEPQSLQVLGLLQDQVQQVPLVLNFQGGSEPHLSQQSQQTNLWVERLRNMRAIEARST